MAEIPVDREHREYVDREHREYHDDIVAPPPALMRRASWGAIFAGAIVALAIYSVFGLAGLGMGLGAIDPMDPQPFSGIGTGTIIWWIITSIVAMAVGGYVGGRLAGIPRSLTAMLHGLSIWALVTIVSLWLATSAIGKVVNMAASVVVTTAETAASAVSSVGGAAAGAVGSAVPNDPQLAEALRQQGVTRENIRREAEAISSQAGLTQQDAQAARQAVGSAVTDMVTTPGDIGQDFDQLTERLFGGTNAVLSDQERQRLIQAISQRAGVSPEEAQRIAGRWEQQAGTATQQVEQAVQQARQRAGEISADALDALSAAAWGAFIASVISLIAALAGAALGAPHTIPGTRVETR